MDGRMNEIDLAGMPASTPLGINEAIFPVVKVGGGTPILFAHGAWADHRIWCGFWKPISRKASFMAVTQRHFGSGSWPDDKPFSRKVHTDDLIALLGKLEKPVHLAGWSYAGGVLLRAAAAVPERVRSLTIFEPSFECEAPVEAGPLQQARDEAWKRLEPAYQLAEKGELEAAMRAGIEAVYSLDEGGFSGLHPDFQTVHLENCHTMMPDLRAELAEPVSPEEFARIRCPALILFGENSLDQYKLMAEHTANSLADAKLVKLQGVSHGGPVQRPDLMANAMLEFISGQPI
jgi:pimeloyl-ACP methyl ester carboxylesterase